MAARTSLYQRPFAGRLLVRTGGMGVSPVQSERKRAGRPFPLILQSSKSLGTLVLLDLFDIRQHPGTVEVGLGRAVETEVGEPAFAGDGFDPVGFGFACGHLRAEVEIGEPSEYAVNSGVFYEFNLGQEMEPEDMGLPLTLASRLWKTTCPSTLTPQ